MTSVANEPSPARSSQPWLASRTIRQVALDESLSFDARGLWILLAFEYAKAPPSFSVLVAGTPDGPYTTRRALEELREAGMIVGDLP